MAGHANVLRGPLECCCLNPRTGFHSLSEHHFRICGRHKSNCRQGPWLSFDVPTWIVQRHDLSVSAEIHKLAAR
jgi:hypothetical protein